ncbi:MAG: hypothetical protein JEZ08_14805 [Clostridiales bacterium]|nr:hypothetical protein [Clostridiales bacterium]
MLKAYKDKMYAFMGPKSIDWLNELESLMDYASTKWQLSNLSPMDLSYNYVCSGHSEIYGEIVLKICLPGNEFQTEYHALTELNDMVSLLDSDYNRRILLLKRLIPGKTLWSVNGIQNRLDIATRLISDTPSKLYKADYPEHKQWIDKIYTYAKTHFKNHRLLEHLERVRSLYPTLNVEGNDIMLLHGDLHHGNILSSDKWAVIDPKGVIGHKSLEVGRYMNNQIQEDVGFEECLKQMVEAFSATLLLDEKTILLSFYIDMVLSTSWFLEDHDINVEMLNKRIKICDSIKEKL